MDKFIDNGVTLEVFILKLVPEASSIGSNPPPAKLLNVNVGVDFSIVTPPAKVALPEEVISNNEFPGAAVLSA